MSKLILYRETGIIQKIPVAFLTKAYPGLHDLDLDLAVEKAGAVL